MGGTHTWLRSRSKAHRSRLREPFPPWARRRPVSPSPAPSWGEASLGDFSGKKVVLNIFPSIDTGVCAASVRKFNSEAGSHPNAKVLCISADLPFAQSRFCGAEGLSNVVTLSDFRSKGIGDAYGVRITDGPLAGLLSRAVVVVDERGLVVHTEQVGEITEEPNYAAALAHV